MLQGHVVVQCTSSSALVQHGRPLQDASNGRSLPAEYRAGMGGLLAANRATVTIVMVIVTWYALANSHDH